MPPVVPPPEPPPLADVDPRLLERGIRAYLEGDVQRAIGVLDGLATGAPRSARVRLLLGMALHGAWSGGGESDAAPLERSRSELAEAARLDPALVPDPALTPPAVVALYRSLR